MEPEYRYGYRWTPHLHPALPEVIEMDLMDIPDDIDDLPESARLFWRAAKQVAAREQLPPMARHMMWSEPFTVAHSMEKVIG